MFLTAPLILRLHIFESLFLSKCGSPYLYSKLIGLMCFLNWCSWKEDIISCDIETTDVLSMTKTVFVIVSLQFFSRLELLWAPPCTLTLQSITYISWILVHFINASHTSRAILCSQIWIAASCSSQELCELAKFMGNGILKSHCRHWSNFVSDCM